MAKGNGQQRERRAFTAEFKLEAVRRAEERRAAGGRWRRWRASWA